MDRKKIDKNKTASPENCEHQFHFMRDGPNPFFKAMMVNLGNSNVNGNTILNTPRTNTRPYALFVCEKCGLVKKVILIPEKEKDGKEQRGEGLY